MTSTINASTTAGIVTTADTSGVLALQTAGTTAVTVDASQNVTLAGTLTTTGITNSGVATATRFNPTGSSVTGNGMYLPAANSVGISTNGTNAVYIDSSQNVGIGTASPQSSLQVSGAMPVSPTGNGIHMGITTSNTCMQFNAGSGNVSLIDFSTSGTDALGRILYNNVDNSLSISTNSVERARFNSTGAFVLAGGSTSANGIGITFPATQSASSDANTLDDYEEGTYTATLTCGTSGTITLSTTIDTLSYIKIGKQVTLFGRINIASVSSPTGTIGLSIPFAADNSSAEESDFYALTNFTHGVNIGATTVSLFSEISSGNNTIAIVFEMIDAANWSALPASNLLGNGNEYFYFTGSYRASS